ncbi:hypothetical protein ACWOFR_04160 [Carnobacterium gallinarum]|uniref:hypothetical protein n=1 Tax=Carnobacterium gallinarum TaxID=2749 RepID=UPI0005581459|nr:hypothetical protein [Carnobacterium gallinarum]
MKKGFVFISLIGLTLGGALFTAKEASAFENGQPDPNDQSQTISKDDKGNIDVEGWVGEFDPTNPDPEGPDPDPNDKGWVDIDIPTKVLFGAIDSDNGKIKAPVYKITNNSIKPVKVSVEDFIKGNDADKLPDLDLKLAANNQEISLVSTSSAPEKKEIGTLSGINDAILNTSVDFTFKGTIGSTHNYGLTIKPKYTLVLKFEVQ